MQTYAFTASNRLVSAAEASRKKDYFCIECQGALRVRGGREKRLHFYHLAPRTHCRSQSKSQTHLFIQFFLKNQLAPKSVLLEHPFPTISRIADLYIPEDKRVYEIQVSPISSYEVEMRTQDYASLGIEVIWILHTKTFFQKNVTSAEKYLIKHPHYYTSLQPSRQGMFFDQFSIIEQNKRLFQAPPFPINMAKSLPVLPRLSSMQYPSQLKATLFLRHSRWKTHFAGDLFDELMRFPSSDWLKALRRQKNKGHYRNFQRVLPALWDHLLMWASKGSPTLNK